MGLSALKSKGKSSKRLVNSGNEKVNETTKLFNIVAEKVQNIDKDVWEKSRSNAYKPVYI